MTDNDTYVLGLKDSLERLDSQGGPHYYHVQLPDAFIGRAGRVYDRLKGIDNQVDRIPKAQWVDEFRVETDYEAALDIYLQCLAAVSKFDRKGRGVRGMTRKGLYYLALARSMSQDIDEVFGFVKTQFGFQFTDSDRKRLLRVIDSCVRYAPLVWEQPAGQGRTATVWLEAQYGMGKTGHPYLRNKSDNT